MTHRHFQKGFNFQWHHLENLWSQNKTKKKLFKTFVLFGILDDGQNTEMCQRHVISWHPVPLELVSGVQMNSIYSLRSLNCVTGGCLCIKTAYCVFDESTAWYFLEDANSHHISLYPEVKLCLLPFYHPLIILVFISLSTALGLSFLTVRYHFFLPRKYFCYLTTTYSFCTVIFCFLWVDMWVISQYLVTLSCSVFIFYCLYVLTFLLFSLTAIFPYPRHNWNFCFTLSRHVPTLVTAAFTGLPCFPF